MIYLEGNLEGNSLRLPTTHRAANFINTTTTYEKREQAANMMRIRLATTTNCYDDLVLEGMMEFQENMGNIQKEIEEAQAEAEAQMQAILDALP